MWRLAGEFYRQVPKWSVVGGQMVQLHAWRAAVAPQRTTDDMDAGIAARTDRTAFEQLSSRLEEAGFRATQHVSDIEYRWTKPAEADPAHRIQFDLLLPRNMGRIPRESASGKRGFETRGVQWATDMSEEWELDVGGQHSRIRTPSLMGAILAKSVALVVDTGPKPERHESDLEFLCEIATVQDFAVSLRFPQQQVVLQALERVEDTRGVRQVRRVIELQRTRQLR